MNATPYRVRVRYAGPDLEQERRYVTVETELARRQLERAPGSRWLPFSWPELGLLRQGDWREYIEALARYGRALDRYEGELRGGLVPVKFDVLHEADRPDYRIRVHIMVRYGVLQLGHKAPERPHRIDGAPDKAVENMFGGYQGFTRSGIHTGRHGVEAVFSKLDRVDSAAVVAQALFLDRDAHTRLSYEIRSREVPTGQTGELPTADLVGHLT